MNKDRLRLHLRVFKKNLIRLLHDQKKVQTKFEITEFKTPKCDTFFGYYDISPFDDNGHVIYNVLLRKFNTINIFMSNINGNKPIKIAESRAWNWQQGCRLRWMPRNNHCISFNDFINGSYCNRIINVENGTERVVNYPLYDIDVTGRLGLSLDFERLGRLRPGYGYTCSNVEKKDISNQGVELIDITSNKVIKIIENSRIAALFDRKVNLDNCYLNHLSFSPSGAKFLFFFIEIIDGYHMASLITYDIKTDRLVVLDQQEKVSHYVWEDDENIICTAYKDPKHCFYYRYSTSKLTKDRLSPSILNEDGHPSVFDKHCILTDTYPDIMYFQRLFICNEDENTASDLLKIYSTPYITGEKRTDLHPRLSKDKKYIAFDANVTGHRSFYIIKIN